jgi:hypothetical protein
VLEFAEKDTSKTNMNLKYAKILKIPKLSTPN